MLAGITLRATEVYTIFFKPTKFRGFFSHGTTPFEMKNLPIKLLLRVLNLQSQMKLTKITACHEVLSATIPHKEVLTYKSEMTVQWEPCFPLSLSTQTPAFDHKGGEPGGEWEGMLRLGHGVHWNSTKIKQTLALYCMRRC